MPRLAAYLLQPAFGAECADTDGKQIFRTQRFDRYFEGLQSLYTRYAGHRGERFEPPDRVKGMAFAVIPFCWIAKFAGITRFLYQFWKISPKYWGRKEKDHNILWSKWYSRRESNPQRPLRRGLLYPFNYGSRFVRSGRCTASGGLFRCPGGARRSCFYFTPFPWKRQPFFRDKFYNERGVPACRLCCVLQSSDKYSLYFI